MRRTTITLDDELARAAEREARRRNISVSQVAREALAAHLGFDGEPRRIPFAALGASGEHSTARDLEEILAEEWAHARDR